MDTKIKKIQRERRKKRIRAKVFGTKERPRLSIFRSNKFVYAELINDDLGITIVSGNTKSIKGKTPKDKAKKLGEEIAKGALAKKVSLAVFDRGGYFYTGSVEAVADGARAGGLKF